MPYFITDSSPDCSGWATVKEDGEVIGCHTNKQDAIDQMIAVSIAEGIPPGGERDYDERVLPQNYRPASSADVPANHNCGNCGHYKKFYCMRWDASVSPAYYCNAWESVEGGPNDNPGQTVQTGDINDDFPQYQPYINIEEDRVGRLNVLLRLSRLFVDK